MANDRPRRKRSVDDDPEVCSWCSARARWTCGLCGQRVCEGHKINPWDRQHKPEHFNQPLRHCDGTHQSRSMHSVGPLEVEICLDPKCAKVIAKCTHLEITSSKGLTVETKSICAWNEDGTVLTCTFCGVDGT